jgi:hypothetical protein
MSSLKRAFPAAIAVLVLALTLGLSSSFVTTSDTEAAEQPSPVAAPYMVDQDSCTTYVFGYNYPFYGYNPYFMPYGAAATFPCVSPAFCVGSPYQTLYYLQPYVICPGPPASIEVNQASATCASATNIQAKVRDANGLNVLDGTGVTFSVTPFAQITGSVETNGGEATASLTTPTKTSGTLNITITAGSVVRNLAVEVSCSAPGTVSYGSGGSAPASAPATVYVMPSGGSSGGY